MAVIRIRVVAAADANLANIFVPLQTASTRARKKIAEDLGAGGKEGAAAMKGAGKAAADALKPIETEATKAGKAVTDFTKSAKGGVDDLSKSLKMGPQRDLENLAREAQRAYDAVSRAEARAYLGISKSPGLYQRANGAFQAFQHSQFVSGLGVAGRVARGMVDPAMRLGGDLLHGIGVNTDLASMFHQQTNLNRLATDVSNFGYMPNDPRNAARVDPRTLVSEARKVGIETAMNPEDALEGLEKFVGKTGDLRTGRDALKDLAILSKATGSNLSDMASAAGDVSNVLGDVPNKGKQVYEVMKVVAGEGKTGAVLIKDLATQMAKLAAPAQLFEGDRGNNIAILGAMVQEARGHGGASSASQAANLNSFVNTFSKSARIGGFQGFGVDIHGAGGMIRDPREVIVDAFSAAMRGGTRLSRNGHATAAPGGMNNFDVNLSAMFADAKAVQSIRGFEAIFKQTYSASKEANDKDKLAEASAAVRAEFQRLMGAAMDEATVQEDFKRAMATTESQVTVFNNTMAETAGEVETALIPALQALAPEFVKLAQWISEQIAPKKKQAEGDIAYANVYSAIGGAVHAGAEVPESQVSPIGPMPLDKDTGKEGARPGGFAVSPELAKAPAEALAQLDQQIDEQKKKKAAADAAAKDVQENPYGWNNVKETAGAFWGSITGQDSTTYAGDAKREGDRLASLETDKANMTAMSEAFARELRSGQLQVVVVEDRSKKPPPTSAPPDGQMPPNAQDE